MASALGRALLSSASGPLRAEDRPSWSALRCSLHLWPAWAEPMSSSAPRQRASRRLRRHHCVGGAVPSQWNAAGRTGLVRSHDLLGALLRVVPPGPGRGMGSVGTAAPSRAVDAGFCTRHCRGVLRERPSRAIGRLWSAWSPARLGAMSTAPRDYKAAWEPAERQTSTARLWQNRGMALGDRQCFGC